MCPYVVQSINGSKSIWEAGVHKTLFDKWCKIHPSEHSHPRVQDQSTHADHLIHQQAYHWEIIHTSLSCMTWLLGKGHSTSVHPLWRNNHRSRKKKRNNHRSRKKKKKLDYETFQSNPVSVLCMTVTISIHKILTKCGWDSWT